MMRFGRRKRESMQDDRSVPEPTSLSEARAARRISEAGLKRALARGPEVRAVTASLRDHRRDNHFAEMLEQSFRQRKPGE